MTEQEYIKVGNLAKIRIIASAMKDVLEGDEWGVDEETYKRVFSEILDMQQKLFDSIETKE